MRKKLIAQRDLGIDEETLKEYARDILAALGQQPDVHMSSRSSTLRQQDSLLERVEKLLEMNFSKMRVFLRKSGAI